ncbi:MAG: peptide ABC transporter substrate-binding protein [Chloroflexi bacterium]|nr:peptide ABC transporter substrate-binding protein [Chloroflexota bacterium]
MSFKKSQWGTLATAILVGGLFLSGCAPRAATAVPESGAGITAAPEVEEPEGATAGESQVVIVIPEDPPNFNASLSDTGYDALVMELVMLGLADLDPEGNIFPELAAELPTVENGGVITDEENGTMDVTWNLRPDITWSDGTPVSSDDVIFTYEALIDPELGSWTQGIDYVDGIEKVDVDTFIVHYNTIYPGYLYQFGGEQMAIWPAHYCDAAQGFSQWECAQKPLSNGPYLLEEWIVGDHLTFVRNPNYYEKGKPVIDKIIVRIVPDSSVRKTMLINGDADLDMWTTEGMLHDLKDEPNVEISTSPNNRWVMRLFLNLAARGTTDPAATPHPILSDVRVRKAIRMAINVEELSKEIFLGYSKPIWTEFFREPYICNIPQPKYDPEAAKALLEEAGWSDQDGDGVRECHGCQAASEGDLMEMELITYAEYGELLELTQQLIGEMLGEIGMKLNLTIMEGSVMWATSAEGGIEQTGNFDINLWDDGFFGNNPTDFLWELYHSASAEPDMGWNVGRWINPEFDTLLEQSYTLDETVRKDLFCQMATILDEEVPVILLFSAVNAEAHSARLQGVQSTINDLVTWNAADWTLK